MRPVEIVAVGAISALGRGSAAFSVGPAGAVPGCAAALDPELEAAGLARARAARASPLEGPPALRAERLLGAAFDDLERELDERLPGWRSLRTALVVGTSAGGIPSLLEIFAEADQGRAPAPELARGAPYFGPLRALAGLRPARSSLVLAACASSTLALGIACRWLEAGHVDLAIAGGYDALNVFVAAGFEALGAVAAGVPQPFRERRDGMVLGEGAALLGLRRAEASAGARRGYGFILGFGAASDAVHVTAPDPNGRGLLRAARAALADAGLPAAAIDVVSAHATATPYNDAAEARVIGELFGERAAEVVVHPYKAVIGHTLGAAGALELLAALSSLGQAVLPAAVGDGPVDAAFAARLLAANAALAQPGPRHCLKLSAAFGGCNAALVAATEHVAAPPPRSSLSVALLATGAEQHRLDVELAAAVTALDAERLQRLDPLSELVVAAALDVSRRYGAALPDGTGLVLGTSAATIETNHAYDQRRRQRGARFVEPRRFPATSPNLAAGQASIALGLRGPTLTVGRGGDPAREALLVAYDLVAAGDAPAMLVVAAEATGPTVDAIWVAADWPNLAAGAAGVLLGRATSEAALFRADQLDSPGQSDAAPRGWEGLLPAARRATAVASLPV